MTDSDIGATIRADTTGAFAGGLSAVTVTFLFTDIEGSTKLWEQDPEGMHRAMLRHDALVESFVAMHGGQVVRPRGEGDSRFAVFGRAADGVTASAALQQALDREPWPIAVPLRVRMALHTGEADLRAGDYYGVAVNRCARLRALAQGGQVLLSSATTEQSRSILPSELTLLDLGTHRLKDLTQPEHIFQLVIPGLASEFPPLRSLSQMPTNLPIQRSSFVGRADEVAQVSKFLLDPATGLVTLVGPGGMGKTRLALQVAAELAEAFLDGLFFVNLAPLMEPALVLQTIAQTLNVREEGGQPLDERLRLELRDKRMLLVLDNFEQVVQAADEVGALQRAAPHVKLLVTSRVPLHLYGEQEFLVPPLALPAGAGRLSREELLQYEAVRLFIERAQAARADFRVTEDATRAIADICARLDGLPLAIELAAARVKLLTPRALLARLNNRLQLLTGGARNLPARHQTLRATIEWSVDLLNEGEKTLFNRLAIFMGGRTLEAIEAVCNSGGDLPVDSFEGVASLLDKSLLVQEEGVEGEPRFVMLETIHEYARECLRASGEEDLLAGWHASHFLTVAEGAEAHLTGPEQGRWLEALEMEHNNFRAALRWTTERGSIDVGMRLALALYQFWLFRGHFTEGRQWYEALLEREDAVGSPLRARVLHRAGALADEQGEYVPARRCFEASLTAFRALGDGWGIAASLNSVGVLTMRDGDNTRADALFRESLAIKRELGDRAGTAITLNNLAELALRELNYAEAVRLLEETIELERELGNAWGAAIALFNLGQVASTQNEVERAGQYYRESLPVFHELSDKLMVAHALAGMARLAAACGNIVRASRLCGAVEPILEAIGATLDPDTQAEYDRTLAQLRSTSEGPLFFHASEEGRTMTMEQVVRYALEEESDS